MCVYVCMTRQVIEAIYARKAGTVSRAVQFDLRLSVIITTRVVEREKKTRVGKGVFMERR